MNRIVCRSLFLLIILFGGCAREHKYAPNLTLTKTGPTIDAVAEFHSLYPAFELMSGKEKYGLYASTTERVQPSELTDQVEHEILTKLDVAGVFSRITRFDPHPDVILTGRITALHEDYRSERWATMTDAVPYSGKLAQLLRLKTHVSSGEVHLTLLVLKSTGEVLGTYTGKSSFKESFTPSEAGPLPGTFLNQALSDAVHQIQIELSHDVELRNVASH
jgi:hypothetical protein